MRALIQRVHRAQITCSSGVENRIGRGFVVLLGIHRQDGPEDLPRLAQRIATLRLMPDADGVMNLGLREMNSPAAGRFADGPPEQPGEVLLVSQFTLFADTARGRRPYYGEAAGPDQAIPLYQGMIEALKAEGIPVATGVFGDHMDIRMDCDGPVTILLDSRA
jgi:D-tyrosyl-tRNA(Tyr) deacylase